MNMKGFSNIEEMEDFRTTYFKETDEVCEVHNVNYVSKESGSIFCPGCRKEQIQEENKLMAEYLTSRHLNNDSEWLSTRSIYVDKSLRDATMENFLADDDETTSNKEMAKVIARGYFKGGTYNTILSGVAGTGKSHLAMAILGLVNEHSDPPKKCLFIALDELLKRIRESFDDKHSPYTEQAMTKMLSEASLLVIDDLGSETSSLLNDKAATDFTTRILYSIFTARMTKPTIITTNLNSEGIRSKYDDRLVSRMFRGAEGHIITFKNTNDKRKVLEF